MSRQIARSPGRRVLISLLILLIAVGFTHGPAAWASNRLDQSAERSGSTGAAIVSSTQHVAQTFTAGRTGELDRIELPLSVDREHDAASDADKLRLEIRLVNGGKPASSGALASAEVAAPSLPPWPTNDWMSVTLASPASITSGEQYAIVASTSSGRFQWGQASAPYAGGQRFWTAQGNHSLWYTNSNFDMAFRTYVTSDGTLDLDEDGYLEANDCDDKNALVNPGATEIYNMIDDDCDGSINEGYAPYYLDSDSDGYGAGEPAYETSPPDGYSVNDDDCDDNNVSVNPGATETYNVIDDDCDGSINEGYAPYYLDSDSDGYGAGEPAYDTSTPAGYSANDDDCDNSNALVNPGATESYNSIDDDCDGSIDEGFARASAPAIGNATSGARGGSVNATARWAPPVSDGGSTIAEYKVQALKLNSSGVVIARVTKSAVPTAKSLVMRLSRGRYKFRVGAVNAVGQSAWSASSNVVRAR